PSGWWTFRPGNAGFNGMLWSTPIADQAIPAPAATVAIRGTLFTSFQISLPSMSSPFGSLGRSLCGSPGLSGGDGACSETHDDQRCQRGEPEADDVGGRKPGAERPGSVGSERRPVAGQGIPHLGDVTQA